MEKDQIHKKNTELQFELKMLKIDLADSHKRNESQLNSNAQFYKDKIGELQREAAQYKKVAVSAETALKNHDVNTLRYYY